MLFVHLLSLKLFFFNEAPSEGFNDEAGNCSYVYIYNIHMCLEYYCDESSCDAHTI